MLSVAAGFLFSCSDSDDCQECHIAWTNVAGDEVEVEIGEFCGAELTDVEGNGYTLDADQVVGNDTVPAADYPGTAIHCEEHHDDDH